MMTTPASLPGKGTYSNEVSHYIQIIPTSVSVLPGKDRELVKTQRGEKHKVKRRRKRKNWEGKTFVRV